MSNGQSLPTDYHYVYMHVDPNTDELLYVGHGSRGRAWTHGSKHSVLRSQEHLQRLDALTEQGFIPSDWVVIVERNLSKKTASEIEQRIIRDRNPLFNKPQGVSNLKMTMSKLIEAKSLRDEGLTYEQIGKKVGVSTMTVYRGLNNQTKNLEVVR